ncbi:MAG: tetracycline resistance MFS efflux pump, partial [Gemmatimonadaceae bacterium]
LISKQVGPSEQGQVQGANSSLMAIAGMIGPALFTGAFSWAIGAGLAWHIPGLPFFLAAVLFALAGITALRATRARADTPPLTDAPVPPTSSPTAPT